MPHRTALLLASAALLGFASPALAQDDRYRSPAESAEDAIDWQTGHEVVQPLPGDYAEQAEGGWHEQMPAHGRRRDHGGYHDAGPQHRQHAPRLGYSAEERAAWLDDCQIVMRGDSYYSDVRYEDDERYDDRRGNRGLRGGLLGALFGGILGNRIADGDRLAGTVIGAGVGGLAGAAIDGAFDRDERDRDEDYRGERGYRDGDEFYAADYCEAYLRRYEASGQAGYGQMMVAQPMMVVGAPMRHGAMREIIREEWVEVEGERVQHVRRPAPVHVQPERGKRTPIR